MIWYGLFGTVFCLSTLVYNAWMCNRWYASYCQWNSHLFKNLHPSSKSSVMKSIINVARPDQPLLSWDKESHSIFNSYIQVETLGTWMKACSDILKTKEQLTGEEQALKEDIDTSRETASRLLKDSQKLFLFVPLYKITNIGLQTSDRIFYLLSCIAHPAPLDK